MRLLTRARYMLANWALKGAAWQYTPTWVSRTVLNGAFHSLVSQGYKRAAAYFACVETHAFTFPEPPLWVWDGEDDNAKPITNHPIRRLLLRPNGDMDEVEFKSTVITWASIGGNCYIHKLRNNRRGVIGLRPYHDGVMRPVPVGEDADGDSMISHYMFRRDDGQEVEVPKEDVIHFQWPSVDPVAPWMAQPPILAAARDVDAVNEASRFVSAILQNDGVPRTVITQSPQTALTPGEVARMRAEYLQMHGGDNRGGVAILESGATIQRLGMNMQELDVSALHDMPEQHICAVMKVPSPVAGLGDDPTYANSEEASKRFTTDTRVPLWRRFESAIQIGLEPDFGNGVSVRHYLGRVAALQEDATAKSARVYGGFDRGLIGFYEGRAQLGITTDPDPRDLFVSSLARELVTFAQLRTGALPAPTETITVVEPRRLPAPPALPPDDEAANELADEAPELGTRARKAAKAKASATRIARALQRVRRDVASRMEPRIERAFEELARAVVSRAEDAGKAREQKALPDVAQLLLPDDAAGLLGVFRVFTLEVLRASWELWNQALDVELAFDESDPAVVAALGQSSARIGGILDTTRDAVRGLLAFGAGEGWTVDQLVRGTDERPGLRALVEQTYRGRARTIARTETAEAQQTAAVSRYRATGVRNVLVLDNGQDDPDDACRQLNGTVQTLEWAEQNKTGHPNCTRSFAPSFDD
jgi:HK97 family phage portal protein